jgi:hypothetical protein
VAANLKVIVLFGNFLVPKIVRGKAWLAPSFPQHQCLLSPPHANTRNTNVK